ncbi:hypothetical protein RJT34_12684 [Clitoria ternatea]|uniref:RBR-type E3 ubiquitin transferase n=1 Tax=Clitoria ternatea TaxID=43366 RepID=A0AAN9JMM9_CLITE
MLYGETSRGFCRICYDLKQESEIFRRSGCSHSFCSECISNYVASQLQNNVLRVNCPNPGCEVELEPRNLGGIVPNQVIARWESARDSSMKQHYKGHKKRSKSEKRMDKMFLELAKTKTWKRCPQCSAYVEKAEGCSHIQCRCGCDFCHICGKRWKNQDPCMCCLRSPPRPANASGLWARLICCFKPGSLRLGLDA